MRVSYCLLAAAVLCSFSLTSTAGEPAQKKEEWIQLFNGKDLTGWKAVDGALFGSKGAITKIYNSGGRL